MYIKANRYINGDIKETVLLNDALIESIIDIIDNEKLEVKVSNSAQHYIIELNDFIQFNCFTNDALSYIKSALSQLGYTENNETTEKTTNKEPDTLGEICDVTFEYGRVCLRVHKDMIPASRKFGLLDKYEKYEFDGGTMYFYKPGSDTSDWSIECGCGSSTLVSNSVKQCSNAVKQEMTKQLFKKKIKTTGVIVSNLPVHAMGYNFNDFEYTP